MDFDPPVEHLQYLAHVTMAIIWLHPALFLRHTSTSGRKEEET